MKCFYHHDHDAVGTCKSCQRGLCPECAVDLDQGLACRSRCEEDVRKLIQLIQNNIRLAPTSTSLIRNVRRNGLVAASFYLAMGVMFTAWGASNRHLHLIIAMGALFIVYGLFAVVRVLRIAAPKEDRPPS